MSLTPQALRKRDRLRDIFGRPRPSSVDSPGQAIATASQTPTPDASAAKIGTSILADALEALSRDDRDVIRDLLPTDAISIDAAVEAAHGHAKELQRQCAHTRWSWQYKGRQIHLSDHMDKVLQLLDKVKSAGDIAVNADPIHAGLPWAGIRIILEVC